MRVTVVAVGRVKERGVREALDEYLARARRHLPIDEVELKDGPPAVVTAALARAIPPSSHVVALEVGGKQHTSEGFAAWLARWVATGKGSVTFLIGGAEGIPPEASRAVNEALSLSTMTLPHRLARLVLAEQLYRATAIWRGEPYPR